MSELLGLSREELKKAFIELIRRTSADLPEDVLDRIRLHRDMEEEGSKARATLDSILKNTDMASSTSRPICQDTGTVTFEIDCPFGLRHSDLKEVIQEAVRESTSKNYLRPNVVDTLTGLTKYDNIGDGHPSMYFNQTNDDTLEVMLVLKGGGCENVGAQFSLPKPAIGAGRDLNGVKKGIIEAVVDALGKGCAPGVLGIGIGGDRLQSYKLSKKMLHRKLDDINPHPELAELEQWLYEKCNTLGIGPMGFGGKSTLLGVKAGAMDRIPASYFVAMTYMCWAYRRRIMTIKSGEVTYD